jgi:hypothetical protein
MRSTASVRVSRKRAVRSSARLAAIWSITPTRTPTKSCSARWAASASATSSSASPNAARSVRSRLTVSAALDATPAPIGTLEAIRASKPRRRWPAAASAAVQPWT